MRVETVDSSTSCLNEVSRLGYSEMRYELLTIETFGRQLVTSGDLDPVYLALTGASFDPGHTRRWLVAYIAFYHCGAASYLSEVDGAEFWRRMLVAAQNEQLTPIGTRWPRGHERRHFRGAMSVRAIRSWADRYGDGPDKMFEYIAGVGGAFREVFNRACEHASIGPWAGFKCVDLADACLGAEVDQHDSSPFLYETPRESLVNAWRAKHSGRDVDEATMIEEMLSDLRVAFSDLEIPHKVGQPIDLFCLETIACKHKSHLSGHYPLWNDIDEINRGLMSWSSVSESARRFRNAMPERVYGGQLF